MAKVDPKEIRNLVCIRFDGPPSPEAGRFVEVELNEESIRFGQWVQDGDYWLLVLPAHATPLFPVRTESPTPIRGGTEDLKAPGGREGGG